MVASLDETEQLPNLENMTKTVNNLVEIPIGGKKKRKRLSKSKGTRSTKKGTRSTKKKGTKKNGTKKNGTKRGPSKWIMHVKAFCRKTGKNFPNALKDPLCRKTFKH